MIKTNTIIQHDVTKDFPLPDECIDVVITSPPYWGLRDYGVDGQIGLEKHPQEYIDKLVGVCREIKRVLKKYGSFYLNLGDTYCSSVRKTGRRDTNDKTSTNFGGWSNWDGGITKTGKIEKTNWLQPKQLMLIPVRVAIALQDDGWVLRNDIIWHKSNPMPSSVKDRLNNTFEHVFHFVKSHKYYYDLDAIREPHKFSSLLRYQYPMENSGTPGRAYPNENRENPFSWPLADQGKKSKDVLKYNSKYKNNAHGQTAQGFTTSGSKEKGRVQSRKDAEKLFPGDKKKQQEYINFIHDHTSHQLGRNPGDFLTINSQPFTGYCEKLEHFAVFPEELIIKPLKASCPHWICKSCSKPRERITKSHYVKRWNRSPKEKHKNDGKKIDGFICPNYGDFEGLKQVETVGWTDCGCNAGWDSGIVLDPFCGRGTVGKVAKQLGLNYILFDIKPEYCELARLYINGQKHKLIENQGMLFA